MTSSGSWLLLLHAGDEVELGSGAKTVSAFSRFSPLPGSAAVRRRYNAHGGLALAAKFTDGTQALLRITLP